MPQQPNEIILLGGRVITMEPDARMDATAILIRADRIVRLFRREEVAEIAGPDTAIIDLGHRPLLPGFVDVHAHSEVVCRTAFNTVDCRAPECQTVHDVCDALASGAAHGSTEWIVGQANLFFDRKLKEGRLPTREELDRVSRDRPIALRAGGHITVLNSKALEVAGIDRNFVPPPHSVTGLPDVVRDQQGNPTGVVKEMDSLLPLPSVSSAELRTALEHGYRHYFTRFGVTTIGEISETVAGIECMNDLANDKRLPVSLRIYLWAPGTLESTAPAIGATISPCRRGAVPADSRRQIILRWRLLGAQRGGQLLLRGHGRFQRNDRVQEVFLRTCL